MGDLQQAIENAEMPSTMSAAHRAEVVEQMTGAVSALDEQHQKRHAENFERLRNVNDALSAANARVADLEAQLEASEAKTAKLDDALSAANAKIAELENQLTEQA